MDKRALGTAIAAAVALAAGAYLVLRSDDEPEDAEKPPEGAPACPGGTFWSTSDSRCVPTGTPPVAAANDGLVPYPAHPRILFFGGETALHTAEALNFILGNAEHSTGLPLGPSNTAIWSGQGIAQIEAFAQGIDTAIPAEILAAPPDIALVMVGEWNAKWGPVDDSTQAGLASIIARLVKLLPATRAGSPVPATNIILVKPWQKDLKHTFSLIPIFDGAALGALGRAFPFFPKGSDIPLEADGIHPTTDGYAALASQIANLLLRKVQQPAATSGSPCPTGWVSYSTGCVPNPADCPDGMTPDGAGGCVLEAAS